MRLKLITIGLTFTLFLQAQDGLPTNPTPGKCYVKCITPDEFTQVEETLVVEPEYKILKVVPATYRTVEETVLVKEASKKFVIVPATYETVSVNYMSKEAEPILSISPAIFGTNSKTFEVYPYTSGWAYTTDPNCKSANKEDCLVACYKEYPARSQDVAIRTLTQDASFSRSTNPEKYTNYVKQVIKTPSRVEEIDVPAEYGTIRKQVIATPATTTEVTIPSQSKTVTRTVLSKKGGMTVWEELDCNLLEPNVLPILYPLNSAELTAEARRIIDQNLYQLLTTKPLVKVEIMSHTDSRGGDDFNMALSQQRAQSVVNYLASKGISRDRLVAKGYGETRLKNKCANGINCTENQHSQNRRTEFRIVNN